MKQKLKIVALILAVAACAIAAIGGTVLVGRLAERLFDAWTAPPPKPHTFAATPIQGPPNPVYLADGVTSSANLLGIAGNPMVTTGGGGYVTVDGGTVQTDPIPQAIALNQAVVQNTLASAGVLVDGGSHYLVSVTVTNEGLSTAWWQAYSGQTVPDAGGTNDAGTVPTVQMRCPGGTICGLDLSTSPVLLNGAVWYSSSTPALLTVDAGTQSMTVNLASLR